MFPQGRTREVLRTKGKGSSFFLVPPLFCPALLRAGDRLHNDGGEGGIRTLEAGFSHLRDFQSRSFGQLGHLSVFRLPGTSSQYGGALLDIPLVLGVSPLLRLRSVPALHDGGEG